MRLAAPALLGGLVLLVVLLLTAGSCGHAPARPAYDYEHHHDRAYDTSYQPWPLTPVIPTRAVIR
jgi:hypothetical protein